MGRPLQWLMTGSNVSLNSDWLKPPMNMRYTNSLRLRWDGVYGENFCLLNLQTISYCSPGRCASWQRPQSVPRMHDRRIQRGWQQSDKLFGVITPKAKFSFCEPVSLTWCRCRYQRGVDKLISWVFRPGHTLGSQFMKCSMSLHVFLVSLRLPPLRQKCCGWPQVNVK